MNIDDKEVRELLKRTFAIGRFGGIEEEGFTHYKNVLTGLEAAIATGHDPTIREAYIGMRWKINLKQLNS